MIFNRYYAFLLESVLLSSNDFSKTLNSLGDDPIAKKIKDLLGSEIETKYNYLDISDEEDKLSFIPDDKYQKGILRPSTGSIGRLVRTILLDNSIKFTDAQIEEFVYKYKASIKIQKELDIRVVEGEDVRFWYDEKNHHESALNNSSSLANSCMRFDRCSKYFDIYVKNPETIKMVIYLEDGLLKARALLWKTDLGYYLDRVYSSERSLENLLLEWAKKEYGVDYSFSGSVGKIKVDIKDSLFLKYPYMDTFKYLDTEANCFMNYTPSTKDYIVLEDTHGGFIKPKMVWSNYLGQYIEESDAVWIDRHSDFYSIHDVRWSDQLRSYIPIEDAVWSKIGSYIHKEDSCEVVTYSGEKVVLPINHEDVVFDEDSGEYKHIDFCVWSEFEDRYISESSIKVTKFNTSDLFNSNFGYVSIPVFKSLKSAGIIKSDLYENHDYISEEIYIDSLYSNSSYEKLLSISKKISSNELMDFFLEEIEKADIMLMFTKNYYNINYDKIISIDLMKSSWLKMIKDNPKISLFVNSSRDKETLLNPYDYIKSSKTKSKELIDLSRKISLILDVKSGEMDKIFYIAVQSMVNYISNGEKYSL